MNVSGERANIKTSVLLKEFVELMTDDRQNWETDQHDKLNITDQSFKTHLLTPALEPVLVYILSFCVCLWLLPFVLCLFCPVCVFSRSFSVFLCWFCLFPCLFCIVLCLFLLILRLFVSLNVHFVFPWTDASVNLPQRGSQTLLRDRHHVVSSHLQLTQTSKSAHIQMS